MPCASRSSTGRRRAPTSASVRRASMAPATSPTSSGTRPASCWEPDRRSCPADAVLALPGSRHSSGPAEHWILSRCHVAVRDAETAYAALPVRRGLARPAHGHLVRVLRLVPRDGQGAPRGERRSGRARRHLAGAGLGPRPLPAHAPPRHAAHHRGDLGPPAPSAGRRRPAHHGCLAGPGQPGLGCGRGPGGRRRRPPGAGDPDAQRPRRRRHRARHLAAGRAAFRRRA